MQATALTQKIGIKFPIIQAPMAGGATTAELVAAVSNAGALGSLAAGYMKPEQIRQTLRKIKQLTRQPFSVNLFIPESYEVSDEKMQNACNDINQCCFELAIKTEPILPPYSQPFEDQVNVLLEEKIPVFSYTFGALDPIWIEKFKKTNTILIGTATSLAEALVLEKSGIDIIVAQGSEAGGHRGTFLGKPEEALTRLQLLIPQLVNKIKIPLVAAGGIMNGKGIIAAMNSGATGVQMGTAFLTCDEAGIPQVYKQYLLAQKQDNTVLTTAFSGKLARGINNKFIKRLNNKGINILDYPVQNALTSAMREKAKENNNIDFMSLWAGQSAFLCRKMHVKDLIKILVKEANNAN